MKDSEKDNSGTPDDVLYVGIDVSKDTLAVDAGALFQKTVANTCKEIGRLVRAVRKAVGRERPVVFAFEDTGPYSLPLHQELVRLDEKAAVVNPAKVRHFAKAMGESAKTDPIDARVIRRFAEASRSRPTTVSSESRRKVREMFRARALLVKVVDMLRNLCDMTGDSFCREILTDIVALVERRIGKLEGEMRNAIRDDKAMSIMDNALQKISGVGPVTSAAVVAGVPELGTLGRRRAAALAGLAPFARESGRWKGRSFIGGGRTDIRRSLYMPALSAVRHNKILGAFYERLVRAGKPRKVALTAVMRKLFIHMDKVVAEALYARQATGQKAAPGAGAR